MRISSALPKRQARLKTHERVTLTTNQHFLKETLMSMKQYRTVVLVGFLVASAQVFTAHFASSARADTLYVSTYSSGTVERVSSSGVASLFVNTLSTNPYGVAFDSVGNLFVAVGSDIEKFTPGGVGSVFASGLPGVQIGLAIDSADNVYAASNSNNAITKVSPGGSTSNFATVAGPPGLKGLAFDRAGNLYASNTQDNTIRKFTPAGVESLFASTFLHNAYGLDFDSLGNLYASNAGDNNIVRFTPAGVGSVFAIGLNNPLGLVIDSADNVYVTNFNNDTITKFTPAGVGSVFANTGLLSGPAYIAIGVPEPATGALLILAAAGWYFRRRRAA